jgi:hypothetical protein
MGLDIVWGNMFWECVFFLLWKILDHFADLFGVFSRLPPFLPVYQLADAELTMKPLTRPMAGV